MKVEIRNPSRTLDIEGPMSVARLLNRLDVRREEVLVICDGTLVPFDTQIDDDAHVEVRNVISGGSA